MSMKCLCQICNCGKHHCPCESGGSSETPPDHACDITPIAVAGDDDNYLISEYKRKFTAHPDAEVRIARLHHDEYRPPEGKMADVTTFRFDYVPHPLIPRKPRPQSTYVPPEGDMLTSTTYTEDFHRHAPQRPHHTLPATRGQQQQPATPAKMDGLSTYKDEFRTWPLQRRQAYRVVDNLSTTRETACPFTATTTFRDDFRPVTVNVARQPCRPAASCLAIDHSHQSAPFTSSTNYRLQYVKHPAEALKRPCSAPLRGNRGRTDSHLQLQNLPSSAFQGTTEFRDKYQPWPLTADARQQQLPRQREMASYTGPSGVMAFDTTTHTDYVKHEGAEPPPRALKPVVQAWGNERLMAAPPHKAHHAVPTATTRGRQAERRVSGKPHPHQGATVGPNAVLAKPTTTYRSQYTATKATGPSQHHRSPQARKPSSNATIDQQRSSRRARTPNPQSGKVPACPASFTEPPGYRDTHTTVGGHRMFQRTLSGAEDRPRTHKDKAVAGVTGSQSHQPQRRGHSVGSASVVAVAADGRGRGQR